MEDKSRMQVGPGEDPVVTDADQIVDMPEYPELDAKQRMVIREMTGVTNTKLQDRIYAWLKEENERTAKHVHDQMLIKMRQAVNHERDRAITLLTLEASSWEARDHATVPLALRDTAGKLARAEHHRVRSFNQFCYMDERAPQLAEDRKLKNRVRTEGADL